MSGVMIRVVRHLESSIITADGDSLAIDCEVMEILQEEEQDTVPTESQCLVIFMSQIAVSKVETGRFSLLVLSDEHWKPITSMIVS